MPILVAATISIFFIPTTVFPPTVVKHAFRRFVAEPSRHEQAFAESGKDTADDPD